MSNSTHEFREHFITPMAAVAGAVADHMLTAIIDGRRLEWAYVNNGGDIAPASRPGRSMRLGIVGDIGDPAFDGHVEIDSDRVRGTPPAAGADARSPSASPIWSPCWRHRRRWPMPPRP
ncbi:MAG: hypothetical protein R3D03_14260 [Geminicoccaceae bacterium]